MSVFRFCGPLVLAAAFCSSACTQSRWLPYGPDGGDARAFAQDPQNHDHVYLGTVSGTLYDTHDGGRTWARLASVGMRDDLVLDNIVVDQSNPNHVLVGGWTLERNDGGLYVSNDAGKTWTVNAQMAGHSVRALAASPSDPKILVLGALDGVYRSADAGATWTLISPQGSKELHEIESIAIDPKNPDTIFAGTWHLPWKTTDGGTHWTGITHEGNGLIDDSDVFSIIIDPANPQNMYLSACSGIYRSVNQGGHFDKVQGIPATARRTHVLMEDPKQPGTIFAGTTEGIWKTQDSGHTFQRNGDPAWIINDVSIDPSNSSHILLATDRNGILLSDDGGVTFKPSNSGFSSRQISAIAQDRQNNSKLYVGVINDKKAGGVFASEDGGLSWKQQADGLNGADIFSLVEAPDDTLLAGTRHGIYRLTGSEWKSSGLVLAPQPEEKSGEAAAKAAPMSTQVVAAARARSSRGAPAKGVTAKRTSQEQPISATAKKSPSVSKAPVRATPEESTTGVFAMAANDTTVFAATEEGLLSSSDNGRNWNHVRSANGQTWRLVAASGSRVAAADIHMLYVSTDKGSTFHPVALPPELSDVTALAIDDGGRVWIGAREGVWLSENDGSAWRTQPNLYVPGVSGIYFDASSRRIIVTSYQPGSMVFTVHTPDLKVTYREAGWSLRTVRPVGDHLVGVTPYDGVVLEPRMVASSEQPYAPPSAGK